MSDSQQLQNKPIRIHPNRRLISIGFEDLIRYREVLYLLVWRDFRVRYRQTLLGILWVILQPVLATAIFAAIFANFARFETGQTPYVLIALSGFTLWMFVNSTVAQAAQSLLHHEQLVTKIYFPRLFVPSSMVFAGLPDLALTLPLFAGVVLYYGLVPGSSVFWIPLAVAMTFMTAMSFSLLLAALNVRFRDVKFVTPFFLQVWMFASPVFYPGSWIPERLVNLFALNPMFGAIELFRAAFFSEPISWEPTLISLASLAVISIIALFVFKRMEDDFADLL